MILDAYIVKLKDTQDNAFRCLVPWTIPRPAGTDPSTLKTVTIGSGTETSSLGTGVVLMLPLSTTLVMCVYFRFRYYGHGDCKWWHFYPDERLPALKEKFNQIMDTFRYNYLVTDAVQLFVQYCIVPLLGLATPKAATAVGFLNSSGGWIWSWERCTRETRVTRLANESQACYYIGTLEGST